MELFRLTDRTVRGQLYAILKARKDAGKPLGVRAIHIEDLGSSEIFMCPDYSIFKDNLDRDKNEWLNWNVLDWVNGRMDILLSTDNNENWIRLTPDFNTLVSYDDYSRNLADETHDACLERINENFDEDDQLEEAEPDEHGDVCEHYVVVFEGIEFGRLRDTMNDTVATPPPVRKQNDDSPFEIIDLDPAEVLS